MIQSKDTMRTLLFLFAFSGATLTSFAQEDNSKANPNDLHLKFKGISINGSLDKFVIQLEKQEFKVIDTTPKNSIHLIMKKRHRTFWVS